MKVKRGTARWKPFPGYRDLQYSLQNTSANTEEGLTFLLFDTSLLRTREIVKINSG